MTPIVGLLSDKFNSRWGKRKPWYVIGTFLVIPSLAGIFMYPPWIEDYKANNNEMALNIWYIILATIFCIGWAPV
jgi:Na+/melibiose symporter-like transporter